MNNNYIIMLYSVAFATISIGMENVTLITTLDNKKFTFPQWKIEASRLLHTKQQWQLFKEKYHKAEAAGIILKTIDSTTLDLFSQALDASDLPNFFNTLTPEKKRLLMCAAGQQELDSSLITTHLVNACFIPELIERINANVCTSDITNYLQYLAILDNCKNKKFVQTKSNYTEESRIVPTAEGYNCLPVLLQKQTNFCGATYQISCPLSFESNDLWFINNCTNHAMEASYFLTSIEPNNDQYPYGKKSNKKKLSAGIRKKKKIISRIIAHTNTIELSAFSNDAQYLATSSEGQQGELILTDLTIQNDELVGTDRFLTGVNGAIDWICFNNRSTVLTALSEKKLFFWDIKTGLLLASFDKLPQEPQQEIISISFNRNDSRLVIASFDHTTNESAVTLWDATNITQITLVKTVVLSDLFVSGVEFTPCGDRLIIGTNKSALLLDGQSGDRIMDTGIIQEEPDTSRTWVRGVVMKHLPIFVTSTHNNNYECNVALWDVNSGKCIIALSEKEHKLVGIGVTYNDRCVVSTTDSYDMIKTELYNDTIENCLKWSLEKMSLLQKYVLLRLYRASKLNDPIVFHLAYPEMGILKDLPVEPVNIKEFIEKYLYKKDK